MKRVKLISIVVALALFLLPGCVTFTTIPSKSSTSQDSTNDPLVGSWQMTRLSITPSLPAPNMVINQVIPESGTWTISRINNQLTINYDGRDSWYKTLGLNVNRKPVVVTENTPKTAYTFESGGNIYMDKLPGPISFLVPGQVEKISVDFDDEVKLNLSPDGKLAVVINVSGNGTYYREGGVKTFSQSSTITYQGIRK